MIFADKMEGFEPAIFKLSLTARKKYMQNKAMLTRLRNQFNRLSKERQAEILGMAKALTYAQQKETFNFQAFVQEIVHRNRTLHGGESKK
ncbi:MAG: hypothetical protein LBG07_02445 [Treponema sp.]|nr:hypothetical protein [Treponema sp.]